MLRLLKEKKITEEYFETLLNGFHDAHAWCVMDGKVIDPTDISPGNEWAINHLNLEKTPTYVPYDDNTQKLFTEEFIFRMVVEKRTKNVPKRPDFYKTPKYGYCYYNAWAFKQHNPTAKIVFGAVGFKYKRRKGKKNRNQKPRYWVQYGHIEGGVARDDTIKKALEYAVRHKDKVLEQQILNNLRAIEEQRKISKWEFVYNYRTCEATFAPPEKPGLWERMGMYKT